MINTFSHCKNNKFQYSSRDSILARSGINSYLAERSQKQQYQYDFFLSFFFSYSNLVQVEGEVAIFQAPSGVRASFRIDGAAAFAGDNWQLEAVPVSLSSAPTPTTPEFSKGINVSEIICSPLSQVISSLFPSAIYGKAALAWIKTSPNISSCLPLPLRTVYSLCDSMYAHLTH